MSPSPCESLPSVFRVKHPPKPKRDRKIPLKQRLVYMSVPTERFTHEVAIFRESGDGSLIFVGLYDSLIEYRKLTTNTMSGEIKMNDWIQQRIKGE